MKSTIIGLWILFVLTLTYLAVLVIVKPTASENGSSLDGPRCTWQCVSDGHTREGASFSIYDTCPTHKRPYRTTYNVPSR